jgi:peroxiredoxin
MRSSHPVLIVISALAVLWLVGGCRQPAQQKTETPPEPAKTATTPTTASSSGDGIGKPVPNFTVTDVDGNSHSSSDYGGKILVVDFWATYCKPCVKKLREYESTYQMNKDKGVDFLALSMDESDEVIKGWRQQNDVNFPLARMDDPIRKGFFGDAALVPIPQMRIVDRKGVIRYSFGADSTKEDVDNAIKVLLEEKK